MTTDEDRTKIDEAGHDDDGRREVQPDPRETDHPTGHEQAAENAGDESPA